MHILDIYLEMWICLTFILFVAVLLWLVRIREGFINISQGSNLDQAPLPDPTALASTIRGLMKRVNPSSDGTIDVMGNDMSPIMNKMQGLLSKYDNPESMGHVLSIKDKDPGELARMYLNINN